MAWDPVAWNQIGLDRAPDRVSLTRVSNGAVAYVSLDHPDSPAWQGEMSATVQAQQPSFVFARGGFGSPGVAVGEDFQVTGGTEVWRVTEFPQDDFDGGVRRAIVVIVPSG